eukprot:gene15991-18034_t
MLQEVKDSVLQVMNREPVLKPFADDVIGTIEPVGEQQQELENYNYNPSPILKDLNNLLGRLKLLNCFTLRQLDEGIFEVSFRAPLDHDFGAAVTVEQQQALKDGYVGKGKSKKKARAAVAAQILQLFNIDMSRYEKVIHRAEGMSPLEALNVLKTKEPSISFSIKTPEFVEDTFKGSLQINEKIFKEEYDYYKDYSYGKHKLALKLLKAASFYSLAARQLLSQLSKDTLFYKGSIFNKEENLDTEFKGDSNALSTMKEGTVANRFEKYGETICAFLNTNGGSLFIGIHDSRVIQGVEVNSCDKFKLRILGSYESRIEPDPSKLIEIYFHPVQQFRLYQTQPPERGLVTDDYVHYLEAELSRLQKYISTLPQSSAERDSLYVIEIRCTQRDPLETFLFDGRAYVRRDGSNSKMSFSELSQRIIEKYKSEELTKK